MGTKGLVADLVDVVRRILGSSDSDTRGSHPRSSSLRQYRRAVEIAWADGDLSNAARGRLDALASELALSERQVAQIEHEVLDSSGLVSPPTRTPDIENPLDNKQWVELVEECVELVEELNRQMAHFDPPRQELADHVILRLEEVLGRSGVEVISEDTIFDRRRHKAAKAEIQVAAGAVITEILSPGFAIGPRVLRRAHVQVEGGSADGGA